MYLKEIGDRQEGCTLTSITWAGYRLDDVKGYEDLLRKFQSDESPCGFVQHKLRYGELQSHSLYPILHAYTRDM